jgi:hypothetical protein
MVCSDPRGTDPVLLHNADKQALGSASQEEGVKKKQIRDRMQKQGLGFLNFEVVPFAFESSGA